ncbi:MAG: tetratricopeptide repeat protein [Calditrichaeota bacterium]|nr:tetratricopeptide repeat protein [Calditrichota bacterium]
MSRALTVSSIIIGLVGIAQYHDLGFTNLPGKYVPYSFMNHKNLFASYLFLTIPFILIVLLEPLTKQRVGIIEDKTPALPRFVNLSFWQYICIFAILTVVYSIVISSARAVWLAMFVSTCVTLVLLTASGKNILSNNINSKRIAKLLLLTVSIAILLIVILAVTLDIDVRTTDNSRFKLWSNTLDMISDNFWIGVGPGNWKIQFPRYGLEGTTLWVEVGMRHFLRPHNDYLLTAAETGVFGFIAYLSVISLTLYYLVRSILRSCDVNDRLIGILFLFGLVGYIVIAFFSYPRERIAHSILFTLMTAWIITKRMPKPQSGRLLSVASLTVYTIFSAIVLSFSLYVGLSIFNSGVHAKAALIAKANKDWEGVIVEIDKADSPFYRLELTSTPLAWYRGVANFALGDHKAALTDFEAANTQHPNHIHVLNNLASSYELMGERTKAIKYYNEALQISPYFDESLMNLSMVYYNLGKYDTAMELLMKCKQKCDKPFLYKLIGKVKEKQQKEDFE